MRKLVSFFSIVLLIAQPLTLHAQTGEEATLSAEFIEKTEEEQSGIEQTDQENRATVEKNMTAEVSTGENTGNNIEEISTGNATAEANIGTNVNTNVEGTVCNSAITTDNSTQGTIDLSWVDEDACGVPPTQESTKSAELEQKNTAQITNDIDLTVETGKNIATGSAATIQTGTASAKVDVANVINTNVSGENGFFGVLNLMADHEGDIILPYELGFIEGTAPFDISSDQILIVQQENEAQVINDVKTLAITGNNSGDEVTTGEAVTTIKIVDKINTNILNSSFLILDIHTFGNWDGELKGWWGNTEQNGNVYRAYMVKPTLYTTKSDTELIQSNKAQVTNDISVSTDTGNNKVEEGEIISGDSNIEVNMFNMVNTNIAGKNWYYMVINVFDTLKGDIIFPRPDLGVSVGSVTSDIREGEEIEYKVKYNNSGLVYAKDTNLEVELPTDVELTSMSEGAVLQDNKLIWDLQKLQKNTGGEVFIKVKPKSYGTSFFSKAFISTSMFEPNKLNNTSIIEFMLNLVKRPSSINQPDSTIPNDVTEHIKSIIAELEEPTFQGNMTDLEHVEETTNVPAIVDQKDITSTHTSQTQIGTELVKGTTANNVQTSSSFPFEYIYFSWILLLIAKILTMSS